ncbi:MAG: M56 family metallopeptidase [Planctomycetota bacterium]|jgi:beta-lactamase regulating signal transducer with metallopeptidase domain/Tol biopolymer transport system component
MEVMTSYVQPFFDWLVQTTLIASMVICLILAAQKTLGGKLGPRWCHALWLVLLIRMVLPWAPSSRLSLFNLIPSWDRQIQRQQVSGTTEQDEPSEPGQTSGAAEAIPAQKSESDVANHKQVTPRPETHANMQSESQQRLASFRQVLPLLWLAGATVIGAYLLVSNFALWRIVKREPPLVNQEILELFEECKAQAGVQTLVAVVPSSQIRSPGLFGFIRPRLLLPSEMLEQASQEEMRYVFLHELAHLKRHDIYLGWLTSLLQVLHWFNPLVWYAFYRMRADRELACDALVLARTQKEQSQEYGRAIVGLLRRFSRSRPLPAMAGILESRSQLKRRITMISQFKKNSYQWSPLAVMLLIMLGCVSLPDAERKEGAVTSAATSSPATKAAPYGKSEVTIRKIRGRIGCPSPDGRYISGVNWETFNVAVRDLATSESRDITSDGQKGPKGDFYGASHRCAGGSFAWSFDSKKIAYDWMNEGDNELRIVGLNGSEPRVLWREDGELLAVRPHAWSQDGKFIVGGADKTDGTGAIVLISVDDGSLRTLKSLKKSRSRYDKIGLSPGGQYVVYGRPVEEKNWAHGLFMLAVDGSGKEKPLAGHSNGGDSSPLWAPDGKTIIYRSNQGPVNTTSLWLTQVFGGKPIGESYFLVRAAGGIMPLGFTREGALYYSTRFSDDRSEIYIESLDMGTGKRPSQPTLLPSEGSNYAPAWSSDGKELAYISKRVSPNGAGYSSRIVLVIRSVESGEEREISPKTGLGLYFPNLRWSPDGRSILYGDLPHDGLHLVDAKSGDVTTIVPEHKVNKIRIWDPQWSIDGKTIFYIHVRTEKEAWPCSIIAHDVASGDEKELYPSGHPWGRLALSDDGKELAFGDEAGKVLKVISTKGGEAREITRVRNEAGKIVVLYPVLWTPDGRHLLFQKSQYLQDNNKVRSFEMWRAPTAGGETEKLWEMKGAMDGAIHPDGQRIAYDKSAGERGKTELWIMENFLPKSTAGE